MSIDCPDCTFQRTERCESCGREPEPRRPIPVEVFRIYVDPVEYDGLIGFIATCDRAPTSKSFGLTADVATANMLRHLACVVERTEA